jgi:hypothetical protein
MWKHINKAMRVVSTCALVAAFFVAATCPSRDARGEVLLKDSFGFAPITSQGGTRFDAAGNVVGVVLHTDFSGLRAEVPNSSSEVWTAPGGHGVPTWGFSVSSPDPYEQYGTPSEPTPADNGTMSLVVFPGDKNPPGKTDALLDFTPPTGAFQESLDVVGGGPTTAIGFTSSSSTLYDNFETFGQIWMVLHGGLGQGQIGTWELHTNGLSGPSVSGTTVLQGFNPIAIGYDPATHTVRGSVNGVLTPAISYNATGITGVGFEGVWTVNNFQVQSGVVRVLAGDANFDGIVNSQDIALISSSWLGTGTNPADVNADGIVNAQDIALVASNWLQNSGPGRAAASAVPEPTALTLLLTGLAAIVHCNRRRATAVVPTYE